MATSSRRLQDGERGQKFRELTFEHYIAFDIGYIDQQHFDRLLAPAEEVARIVGGLRAGVERQRNEQPSKA